MNIFKSRYIKKKFQPPKMGKMKFFHTAFGGLMKNPQTLLAFNTAICLSKSLLLIYINLMVKLAMLFVYYFFYKCKQTACAKCRSNAQLTSLLHLCTFYPPFPPPNPSLSKSVTFFQKVL